MDVERLVLDPVDLGIEREHQACQLLRRDAGHDALEEAGTVGLDDPDLQPAGLTIVLIANRGAIRAWTSRLV